MPMFTKWRTTMSSPRSSLFTIGYVRSASVTARVTNGVYVRLNPSRAANASFTRCRVRTTCSMLTSTMFHARAVVCSDPTMCDAIACGCASSARSLRPPPATTGPGTERNAGAGSRGSGSGGRRRTCLPPRPPSMTSFFVIRPPVPVPEICARSSWCSSASFRTSGERICDRGPRSGSAGARRSSRGQARLAGGAAAEADPGAAAPTASAATGSCAAAE